MKNKTEVKKSLMTGHGSEFGDGYGCGYGLNDFKTNCFAPGQASGKSKFSTWSIESIYSSEYDGI